MKRFTSLLILLLLSSLVQAENWGHWRGPNYNGSTGETNLPTSWSGTENIRWSTDLPGPSAATPIVWEGRVFISSTDPDANRLKAICIDRNNGATLWQYDVAEGISRDRRSTFAAPSPVTDGNVVVFFYSSGEMVAYDFEGKSLWKRNIQKDCGEFAFQWTFSSSPLLYGGRLYLQVLQRDVPARGYGRAEGQNQSYLLAMEPATGKTIWKVQRPSKAFAESREAFSSPVPFELNGRRELLVIGGDALSGHDPETGEELWRWGTWNPQRIGHWRLVPSPVASPDVILACAPKGEPVYAIKTGLKGTFSDEAIAWTSAETRDVTSDVPTPAYYDGDFIVLSKGQHCLSRVEPKTGAVKWTVATPTRRDTYEASPLAGDGKIYLVNFEGRVVIVNAANGKIINEISMADQPQSTVRSSISASGGNLFLRTDTKLYCIGK